VLEPFLILISRPTTVAEALFEVLREAGLDLRLRDRLFDRTNWHQSFSERHPDNADELERLLAVGNLIMAPSVDIVIDSIVSKPGARIDWRFETSEGKTPGFIKVRDAIRTAFACVEGIVDPVRHSPHITFRYGASEQISTIEFPAITWLVDRIELVRRMDAPYRYDTIATWDLLPPTHRAAKQSRSSEAPS
jgi:RNA 2',3'-cyclic 3'-phosphodiesterase